MIDLVPREVVEQWLAYLRKDFPVVAFKSSTQQQRSNLRHASVKVNAASDRITAGHECLGADQLMQLLKNYCRNRGIKTAITVGVIGYPNVGKSSLINSLKRSRACGVGQTPGFTKSIQEISLDKHVRLLDSPGIVFSLGDDHENAVEAVLRNCVKVELLEDPVAPVDLILKRCSAEELVRIYQIPFYMDVNDFLVQVARQRGRLRKVSALMPYANYYHQEF
jgi:nuclear GTP-binding protein